MGASMRMQTSGERGGGVRLRGECREEELSESVLSSSSSSSELELPESDDEVSLVW